MGGNKLNHNKSWNTQSLRHMEMVWKAEQQAAEENKKASELKRQLQEEREHMELRQQGKGGDSVEAQRLEWMYQPAGVGAGGGDGKTVDDMLTGKTTLATTEERQKKSGMTKGGEHEETDGLRKELDNQAKIRADPMLAIKQAEMEQIKAAVERRRMLERISKSKDKKKKKKKKEKKEKKKEKKKKKDKGHDSEIVKGDHNSNTNSQPYHPNYDNDDDINGKQVDSKTKDKPHIKNGSHEDRASKHDMDRHRNEYRNDDNAKYRNPDHRNDYHHRHHRDHHHHLHRYYNDRHHRHRHDHRDHHHHHRRHKYGRYHHNDSHHRYSSRSNQNEEEKEREEEQQRKRKLAEMTENAQWAEDHRRKRIRQLEKQEKEEEEQASKKRRRGSSSTSKDDSGAFLRDVTSSAYMGSTEDLAGRLHRNRHFVSSEH